ncbi:hypothetical protein KSP39_PZI011812 [Platanthera zijinensis]|uniref:Dirigent protein n=1 Tax=Platanthera zijinensis TaxID=2320716 RepID=A0AAP0G4L5_9ASPA
MARLTLLFLLPLLAHLLLTVVVAVHDASLSGRLSDHLLLLPNSNPVHNQKERLTHIRFFWHDIAAGPNATAVIVAQSATTTTTTNFGSIRVMDDALTVGPNLTSQLVGKSQGLYASADRETPGLLMAMTFTFTVGRFNGSTMTILGRNEIETHVREMPIVGGTGVLRFVTGYVQAQTYSYDPKIGYNIIEYNCFFFEPTRYESTAPPPEYVPFF